MGETEFYKKLRELINSQSMENGSDTPDFILAEYLDRCLATFNHAVMRREHYYGRDKVQPLTTRGDES